ncbi:MAG TPA: alpha/beta hydrolase [Phnomibacter sp.]|nr:alpha/beta hydrolase [Phnomibacter sp.]
MQYTFSFLGSSISYSIAGKKGPTVLLLHGFGEDHLVFHQQVDALLHHCRLVLPDLPGSGESTYAREVCSSIDTMAHAMHALMQEVCDEPFVVLGHSMGGYITLAMAEQMPSRIAAFGLLHSTAFADSEEKKTNRKKSVEFIEQNGVFPFIKTTIPGLFGEVFAADNPTVVGQLIERGRTFSPQALIAYYEAMIARPDRTRVLQSAEVPVLFLIGDIDKPAPMADVLQQVHLAKNSEVKILRNTGHMGMLEQPQLTSETITAFIDRLN